MSEFKSMNEAANDPSTNVFAGVKDAADFRKRVVELGGVCSDGPLPFDEWTEGWARAPFTSGARAHYWREVKITGVTVICNGVRWKFYSSECGTMAEASERAGMFGPGNWPRCKNCERMLKARGR